MAKERIECIAAIVRNSEGKILLGKSKKESEYGFGRWLIPGGKIKEGESDFDAIKREMREEAGIKLAVRAYLGETITDNGIGRWYECQLIGSDEARAGDDLVEIMWATREEVLEMCKDRLYTWPSGVRKYFKIQD